MLYVTVTFCKINPEIQQASTKRRPMNPIPPVKYLISIEAPMYFIVILSYPIHPIEGRTTDEYTMFNSQISRSKNLWSIAAMSKKLKYIHFIISNF